MSVSTTANPTSSNENIGAPAQSNPIIAGAFAELPPIGTPFPPPERRAWLELMEATFHLVYHPAPPLQVSQMPAPANGSAPANGTDPSAPAAGTTTTTTTT